MNANLVVHGWILTRKGTNLSSVQDVRKNYITQKEQSGDMRILIAKITGWPLVSFNFGHSRFYRFVRIYEDQTPFVRICGTEIEVKKGNSYHDFRPIMNCEKNGISL